MKVAIYTLGCKLNQAESDQIKEKLVQAGFFVVEPKQEADLYIISCCSITKTAERKTQWVVNRLTKKGEVWITGCVDRKIKGVKRWVRDKEGLVRFLKKEIASSRHASLAAKGSFAPRNDPAKRTRAMIKIQDGCDNYCAYCVIPHFRGKPKSVAMAKIIKEIKNKIEQGYQEVVLTGVNICKYSPVIPGTKLVESQNLSAGRGALRGACAGLLAMSSKPNGLQRSVQNDLTILIKTILTETSIQRLRLGSIDPNLIDDKFINLLKNPRLMPHLHLSLQSGSDKILKAMGRKYTTKQYLNLVKKIKKKFSNFAFTTDVIVGFPGETKKKFLATCRLAREAEFLKIHIFPYSPRPYTRAGKIKNQINDKVKNYRVKHLKKIADQLQEKFQKKMLGKKTQVLWENRKNSWWYGYTENYMKVRQKNAKNLTSKIQTITIQKQNLTAQ